MGLVQCPRQNVLPTWLTQPSCANQEECWYGWMDLEMQQLWKSPSSRRRTWTIAEEKGKRGADSSFRARQKLNTKMSKYRKLNISIQVLDMKPVAGLANEPDTSGGQFICLGGKGSGWAALSPERTYQLAATYNPCGSKAEVPTDCHGWGLPSSRNIKSLMQYARNPGRALLEKL